MAKPQGTTGARDRFEKIWRAHYAVVYAYARRRLPDENAAREVAAESFLVAWRRIADVPASPRPWLLGVARKALANHRRGTGRRDALRVRLMAEVEPEPSDSSEVGPVGHAFNRLSAADQEVLALTVWEELKPREAAVVLGISPAVYSLRLHRAKQRLRKAATRLGHGSDRESKTSAALVSVRPKEARHR